jgi:hypothetical protein
VLDRASNGHFIAYYRVSTAKQGRSGLGIEAQQAAVERGALEGLRMAMAVIALKYVDRPTRRES